MQFGPIRRTSAARTFSTSAASRARPASSVSLNPALMTTMAWTGFARQSSTAAATAGAGTAMTARSTGSARSVTRRAQAMPSMEAAVGCTTSSRP